MELVENGDLQEEKEQWEDEVQGKEKIISGKRRTESYDRKIRARAGRKECKFNARKH